MKKSKDGKIILHSEIIWIIAILTLSFSVAMITITDFGVSMIVAPAYILSEAVHFLSFGQSEYIIQGFLFIIFCLLMKKFKIVYLSSFLTGIIYGTVLDFWRTAIPWLNPNIVSADDFPIYIRIILFTIGVLLTSFSITLFFKTYLYPQVYDFFVKGISGKFNLNRTKFKFFFDSLFLIISIILSLLIFHKLIGIWFGTLIMTCFNGALIGLFGKLLDKYFEFIPIAKNFSKHFQL